MTERRENDHDDDVRPENARTNEAAPAHDAETADDAANDPLRTWIKRSLAESALTDKHPDLLAGVQRRIRIRSRGKFFADGWSTTHMRTSYALIGVVTLLLVALACFVLSPWYGAH
jgi:hypothetical protein